MSDLSVPEEWRSVVDFPAYSVSSLGRVRRELSNQGGPAGRLVKGSPNNCGYLQVQFWAGRTRRERIRLVHHLVMEAFVGQRPEGHVVNHKNGVKTDNRLVNLEYCTPAENSTHAAQVLRVGRSKLGEGEAIAIRWMRAHCGTTHRALAAMFGVSQPAITHILTRKTYAWV